MAVTLAQSAGSMSLGNSKSCRLCVNRYEGESKSLYDEHGRPNALHEIIVKYFHPTVLDIYKYKQFTGICRPCWRHIWKFCNFQKSVHEAQLRLDQQELQTQTPPLATEECANTSFNDLLVIEGQNSSVCIAPAKRNARKQVFMAKGELSQLNSEKTLDELMEEEFITILPVKQENSESANTIIVPSDEKGNNNEIARNPVNFGISGSNAAIAIKSECGSEDVVPNEVSNSSQELPTISAVYSVDQELYSAQNTPEENSNPDDEEPINSTSDPNPIVRQCNVCDKYTRSLKTLQRHRILCHSKDVFSERGGATCKSCRQVFKTPEGLHNHVVLKHGLVMYKFHCQMCDKLFNESDPYEQHMKQMHNKNIKQKHRKSQDSWSDEISSKAKIPKIANTSLFACTRCPETFPSLAKLDEHQIKHPPDEDEPMNPYL